jgi:hypothetical protein
MQVFASVHACAMPSHASHVALFKARWQFPVKESGSMKKRRFVFLQVKQITDKENVILTKTKWQERIQSILI